ncbi:MAG TPA: hypothetical protein VFB66_20240 [Tepidisphaeraceae bacterium]|nr:hypothetical protein [Tepidisphaeraceae bacterium]
MTDEKIDRARERHGFWLARPHEGAPLFVFLPHGTDPADGAPLQLMRQAWPREAVLWEEGKVEQLAVLLAGQGLPVTAGRPSLWRKIKEAIGWS